MAWGSNTSLPLIAWKGNDYLLNQFKAPYFEYLVGNLAHFIDLIVVAQRIEYVIKVGKILVTTKEL